MNAPRIAPLQEQQWDGEVRELLAQSRRIIRRASEAPPSNLSTTLVRNRGLFPLWTQFAHRLFAQSELPARDRELAILRNAWLSRAEYEWGQHLRLARAAGLSEAEIERVAGDPQQPAWSAADREILLAVDELHATNTLSQAAWAPLRQRFSDSQLIEFLMLVGFYRQLAWLVNALGIQLDAGLTGFTDRATAAPTQR